MDYNILYFGEKDDDDMIKNRISDIKKYYPNLNYIQCDYDISDWEHALDIFECEDWGASLIIKRDIVDERQQVKILKFLSENKFKINTQVINDIIV